MVQIIPAIIAKDGIDLRQKTDLVKPITPLIQLDVMDGFFVPKSSFGEPQAVEQIKDVMWEIHLMVAKPSVVIDLWLGAENIQRLIFHYEAASAEKEMSEVLAKGKQAGKEIGLALNLETDWRLIKKWLPQIDLALLMSVAPGQAGQQFNPEVIPKIKDLRQAWLNGKIEVDGGINLESAKKVVEAGANALAVGSFIFSGSEPPKNQIQKLKNKLKNL